MKLTISSHLGQPSDGSQSAVFPPRGGSLGHRSDNTLVLADRHGTIAGRHATFYQGTDGWRIAPEPGATVAVNGHSVAHGHEWPVAPGDVLEIGAYVLTPGEEHSPWSGLTSGPEVIAPPSTPARPHPLQSSPERTSPSAADPLAGVKGRTGLDELQDTPLDPLALFAAQDTAAAASLLDDSLLSGFEQGLSPRQSPTGFNPSLSDSVPEQSGHLRVQIQWPDPESPAGTVAEPVASRTDGEAGQSMEASAEVLLQALRDGLGQRQRMEWPDPDFMRLLGATLRALRTQLR